MEYEIKYDGKIVYKDSLFYNALPGDKFLLSDNHIVTYNGYQNGIHFIDDPNSGEMRPIPYYDDGTPYFSSYQLPIISKIDE